MTNLNDGVERQPSADLHLGVGPPRHLHDHVDQGLTFIHPGKDLLPLDPASIMILSRKATLVDATPIERKGDAVAESIRRHYEAIKTSKRSLAGLACS